MFRRLQTLLINIENNFIGSFSMLNNNFKKVTGN